MREFGHCPVVWRLSSHPKAGESSTDYSCVVNFCFTEQWYFEVPRVSLWRKKYSSLGSNHHFVFEVTFALCSREPEFEAVSGEQSGTEISPGLKGWRCSHMHNANPSWKTAPASHLVAPRPTRETFIQPPLILFALFFWPLQSSGKNVSASTVPVAFHQVRTWGGGRRLVRAASALGVKGREGLHPLALSCAPESSGQRWLDVSLSGRADAYLT